jgi:hypothetical protein
MIERRWSQSCEEMLDSALRRIGLNCDVNFVAQSRRLR